jgi:hypothetical protein
LPEITLLIAYVVKYVGAIFPFAIKVLYYNNLQGNLCGHPVRQFFSKAMLFRRFSL